MLLLSTLLLSLLHLPNYFFGIGSLVPAMLLHGLWDFWTFASSLPHAGLAAPLIGLAGVVVVVRRAPRRLPSVADDAVRPATSRSST